MTEEDKGNYTIKEIEKQKRAKMLSKASYCLEVSIEWNKTNKLTPETLILFEMAMKKAEKEWEFFNASS